MAARCTNPPNSWGYVFPGGQAEETVDRWLAFLFQLGGSVLSPDNTQAVFNGTPACARSSSSPTSSTSTR